MKIPKNIPWTPILYIGGGLLAYKFVLKPLLDKLGITKGEDDKTIEEGSKLPGWDLNFYKQAIAQKKITQSDLLKSEVYKLGTPIKLALNKPFWKDDDEEAVFAAIRKVRTQAELSKLSSLYDAIQKRNLFEHLRSKFSAGEMAEVIKYVKDLPLYKPKTITGLPTVW